MKNNLKKSIRIFSTIFLFSFILFAIISPLINKNPQDLNVYLNEEVCFADNVYIKVDKMAVYENKTINFFYDGNDLSKYILHLNLSIQRRSEKSKNKPITINSDMFQLKNVNLKSKSKMNIFFESMFKATLSALASGAVEGEISIIEETINFTQEYIQTSIENTENNKTDFDPIEADKNSFEPFTLNNQSEIVYVDLYFPIKQEYMDSENCIVLSINTLLNLEKRIFLVPRSSNV